jgi:hypothetical protein
MQDQFIPKSFKIFSDPRDKDRVPQVHIATAEQLRTRTCTHNRHRLLCNPCSLWPGYEHPLFAKAKKQLHETVRQQQAVPHSLRVYQHHVIVMETFRLRTAYEERTDSLHKLIRHIFITTLKTSACPQHVPLTSRYI